MNPWLITPLFAITMVTYAAAQSTSACDAATIDAFRTYYNKTASGSVSQVIHEAACSSGAKAMSGGLVGIGGFNQSEVTKACRNNDMQYFEQHSKEITLSYIPADAMGTIEKVCTRENLNLTAALSGAQVNVRAMWTPAGDYASVKVKSLQYTANLRCTGPLTRRGSVVGSGGSGAICTRSGDAPATIALQTDYGGFRSISVSGIDRSVYKLLIYAADDQMTCFVNETEVGGISMGSRDQAQPAILLNEHFKSGVNSVVCKPVDIHPDANHKPCWYYKYEILKDDKVLARPLGECCGGGCAAQPPTPSPVSIVRP